MKICEFDLATAPRQTVVMPDGARIFSCQAVGDDIRLWALVDPAAEPRVRVFSLYASGTDLGEDPGEPVGTVRLYGDETVMHVFETTGQRPDGEGGAE